MKKIYFITAILFLSCVVLYGQISTQEEPLSFKRNLPELQTSEKTEKTFPLLDMKKIEQETQPVKSVYLV
jgi:hypothetical protein